MSNLLMTLSIGTALIVFTNLALIRWASVSAKWAATVTAIITIGLYVPYSILSWPGGDIFAIHLAIYLLAALICGMLLGLRANGQGLHWAPAILMGFFIFVAVAGAIFIAVAEHGLPRWVRNGLLPEPANQRETVSGFPGVIAYDFHKKEALYNQYLQQVDRQRQRGWQIKKGWIIEPVVNQPTPFRVTAQTQEGIPLDGAVVNGQFLRTSTNKLDVDFALHETAPGIYEAPITLPAAGRWNLVLSIRKGTERHEIQASTAVSERKNQ